MIVLMTFGTRLTLNELDETSYTKRILVNVISIFSDGFLWLFFEIINILKSQITVKFSDIDKLETLAVYGLSLIHI